MNWKRSVKYLLIGVGIMASSTTALHLASRTFIADEAGAMKRLPVLFIHGLDSSKHTWRDVNKLLQGQGYDSVSVDLRGWGSSPLGDRHQFCISNVIEDLKTFVKNNSVLNDQKIIVVGHSMGGRVASCFAAENPEKIAALVVEDMDIAQRTMTTNPVQMKEDDVIGFDRMFESKEKAVSALVKSGYDEGRVQKWIKEGRLYDMKNGGSWWTDVSPETRMLSYRHILCNDCGEVALKKISLDEQYIYPCFLMVAQIESACNSDSIRQMKTIMGNRLNIKDYEGAYHSIHNSSQEAFLNDLKQIIDKHSL